MSDAKQAPKEKEAEKKTLNDKSWLERMVEKVGKDGELHKPFIKALLSVAGFFAGLIVGYFVFGKNKEKEIAELNSKLSQAATTNKELEKEINHLKEQVQQPKELGFRSQTLIAQNANQMERLSTRRELPINREFSYLD